jgi:ABC-type spermidine/putrescine transport system permease subunit I
MTRMLKQGLAATARFASGVARQNPRLTIAALLPVLLLLVFFFIVPLMQLLQLSMLSQQPTLQQPSPGFSIANYARIFQDSFYLQMTATSIMLGVCTTLATVLIAYPVAYYITRISGWERTLISVACLLPIFVNVIVSILGWYILLLPFGVIQQTLAALGIVSGPLQLLRTFPALVAVLTYEHLPFAVLILVSSLQAIPTDKINAARLLGASVPRIVRTIIIPLTMPGLVASVILVFSLSTSSYLAPILIGAQRIPVLPLAIFSYGTELQNWPLAAALAFVLLVLVVAISYAFSVAMNRISRRGQWEMV